MIDKSVNIIPTKCREKYNNEILLFLFSFLILFFTSKCSPLYFFNEWCDPNIYFSIGKGLFHGKVIYKDLFDHKGPLIFFIYGIGSLVSDRSFLGIYFIEGLLLFLNLLFVYKIAKLFLKKDWAFIVPLLYTFLLLCRTKEGGSADEFITPFITISFYYTLLCCNSKDIETKKICKYLFLQGLMFGLVFFIKLSFVVYLIPLLFIPLYKLILSKRIKDILLIGLSFTGGFLLVALPILTYFLLNSAYNDFIFAYFDFNKLYASRSFGLKFDAFANIAARFYHRVFEPDFYLYTLLFGLGITMFSKKYLKSIIDKICILLSFTFLYIMATSGPHDMDYPYVVLSTWSIMGFILIADYADKCYKRKTGGVFKLVFIILIIVAGCINKNFFGEDINCLVRKTKCDYWQIRFAEKINKEENPTLITLDLYVDIFTVSGVVPDNKYFFHPNILDTVFPDIKNSFIENIKEKKTKFVVSANKEFPLITNNYDIIDEHCIRENACIYLFRRKE